MTSNTNRVKRVIAEALRGAGLSDKPDEFDSNIHSWRCEHPDRYGRCKCFEETVADIAAALRAANMLRESAAPDAAPSEDDREATEAEIDKAARALHIAKCCSLSGDSPHDFPEASELFAAGVVLNAVPRAAVPDAATELRAERDAALAAIERCRGVLSAWESRQERNREILGNGALGHIQAIDCTGDLRAALDGAPEPEVMP